MRYIFGSRQSLSPSLDGSSFLCHSPWLGPCRSSLSLPHPSVAAVIAPRLAYRGRWNMSPKWRSVDGCRAEDSHVEMGGQDE